MDSDTKPSKRERLSRFLGRSVSPLPVRPKTVPTKVIPATPSNASTSLNTNIGHDIFEKALESLSHTEQETIRAQLSSSTYSVDIALEQVRETAYKLQQSCVGRRWHWTYKGREIYFQDQADKVLQLLNKFRSVGDVVANVDPIHVGLPWAGIRTLLEVILDTKLRPPVYYANDVTRLPWPTAINGLSYLLA
jgi:hypothetical protein